MNLKLTCMYLYRVNIYQGSEIKIRVCRGGTRQVSSTATVVVSSAFGVGPFFNDPFIIQVFMLAHALSEPLGPYELPW